MSKINIVVAAQTGGAIKGLNDVTKATQRTGAAVRKAQSGMGRFSKEVSSSQVELRKFAMGGLQQAGYQIGDYAVQVANGTSKMQAFGQQAPQLLQIFGPLGAVVGAAVAIFAAFGVAAQKAADASGSAETAVEDLNSAFNTLKQVDFEALGRGMSLPAKMALAEYAGVLEMINKVAEEQRAKAIGSVLDKFAPQAEIEATMAQMRSVLNEINVLPENVDPSETTTFELNEINDRLMEMQRLKEIMNGLDARSREEAAKKLTVVREALLNEGLMTPELRQQLAAYADQFGLVSSIKRQVEAANVAENQRVASINKSSNGMVYQDAIFRAMNVKASNMSLLAKQMAAKEKERLAVIGKSNEILPYQDAIFRAMNVKASNMSAIFRSMIGVQQARLEMLRQEDVLMSQLVVKGQLYTKSPYQGGRGGDPRQFSNIDEFRKQLEFANSLAASMRGIGAASGVSASKVVEVAEAVETKLSPAMERLQGIQNSVGQSFENAMMSAVDGTKSVKDAFKSMASEIIKELYRVFVVKRITGFITDAIGGYFNLNQVSGPSMPLGTGSIRPVARPNYDGGGYTGNGARAGGLDGKGGFMAMMHPRETVTDHTKSQGSGGVTVIQNNTFGSGVTRAEVNAMLPKMVEATKAAVADSRLRGGSYGGAFA